MKGGFEKFGTDPIMHLELEKKGMCIYFLPDVGGNPRHSESRGESKANKLTLNIPIDTEEVRNGFLLCCSR